MHAKDCLAPLIPPYRGYAPQVVDSTALKPRTASNCQNFYITGRCHGSRTFIHFHTHILTAADTWSPSIFCHIIPALPRYPRLSYKMSKRFSSSLGFRMKEGKFSCGYCLDIIHPLSKNPSAEIEGKDRDLAAPTRCDGCEATASLVTRMMSDLGWARWNRGHWTIQVKRKDPERGRATLVACGRDAWGMVLHTFETYTDESRGDMNALLCVKQERTYGLTKSNYRGIPMGHSWPRIERGF